MSKKPDDAARIASLAGILQSGNKPKEAPPSPAPPPAAADAPVSAPPAAVRRSKKEKVGKYRDPDWHQYGVYLRKATHKRTRRRLEDMESDKDLSDLLEELLQQWLASSK